MDERVVQAMRLPDSSRPLQIFGGSPPTPLPCEWLAITQARDELKESFALYFLDAAGAILDVVPFETLRIALDQATALCDVRPDEWVMLNLEVQSDGLVDAQRLAQAVGEQG